MSVVEGTGGNLRVWAWLHLLVYPQGIIQSSTISKNGSLRICLHESENECIESEKTHENKATAESVKFSVGEESCLWRNRYECH